MTTNHNINVKHNFIEISNPYELCVIVRGEISNSKMKYKDIASKARLCPTTVSRLATGETKDPRVNTIISILFVLGRTLKV